MRLIRQGFIVCFLQCILCLSVTAQTQAGISSQLIHFVDSLLNKGANKYLIYKVTCLGESEFEPKCKCVHDGIMQAVIFYEINGKSIQQTFECCVPHNQTIIRDDFFAVIKSLTGKLNYTTKPLNGIHFLPPVATDQVTYHILYYNAGHKLHFSLSENQITEGSEEQKIWLKYKSFQTRMAILNIVKSNLSVNKF